MIDEIPALKGFVTRMLLETPNASIRDIRTAAIHRYPAAEGLTVREFGVRYVLPMKRRMGGPPRRTPIRLPTPPAAASPRAEDAPPPPRTGMPLLDAAIAHSRSRPRDPAPAEAGREDRGGARQPPDPNPEPSPKTPSEPAPGSAPESGPDSTPDSGPDVDPESPSGPGRNGASSPSSRPSRGRASAMAGTAPRERRSGAARPEAAIEGPAAPPAAPPSAPAAPPTVPAAPPSAPAEPAAERSRSELRTLFLRLAMELAAAETDAELVDVLAALDRYVDEALAVAA
jgi:hypothetical protein